MSRTGVGKLLLSISNSVWTGLVNHIKEIALPFHFHFNETRFIINKFAYGYYKQNPKVRKKRYTGSHVLGKQTISSSLRISLRFLCHRAQFLKCVCVSLFLGDFARVDVWGVHTWALMRKENQDVFKLKWITFSIFMSLIFWCWKLKHNKKRKIIKFR